MANALAHFTALPRRLQLAVALGAAFAVVAVVVVAMIARPQRATLFAGGLKPDQMSEVEERLADWNVPFTPVADNVLVDAGARNGLLLKLSLAGVPREHLDSSADVLGKLGALTPQAVIDAQTRDGLADDIALALRDVQGVQDARIIIAPEKTALYADDAPHDASASVRLRTAPGARLSAAAVQGIRAFVAASVAGLQQKNVTIVDDRGVALSDSADEGDAQLQNSLQSALDAALGAGAAIVRVRVQYDRRSIAEKTVRRAPLRAPAISATIQSERYAGPDKKYQQSTAQTDRGSETLERTTSDGGERIARISAAVMIDAARVGDLAPVRALAAAALGLSPARGDVLDVEAVTFSHAPVAKKDAWWLAYGVLVPLLPTVVIAIAVLLLLRVSAAPLQTFLRELAGRASIARVVESPASVTPGAVRGALRNEPPHTAAAVISALPAATAAAVLDMYPPEERSDIVRRMQRPRSPFIPDLEQVIADA